MSWGNVKSVAVIGLVNWLMWRARASWLATGHEDNLGWHAFMAAQCFTAGLFLALRLCRPPEDMLTAWEHLRGHLRAYDWPWRRWLRALPEPAAPVVVEPPAPPSSPPDPELIAAVQRAHAGYLMSGGIGSHKLATKRPAARAARPEPNRQYRAGFVFKAGYGPGGKAIEARAEIVRPGDDDDDMLDGPAMLSANEIPRPMLPADTEDTEPNTAGGPDTEPPKTVH